MNKFKGLAHCRTTNFGSDPRAARCALRSNAIDHRVCVSKNVCHQTLYAEGADGWHAAVLAALHGTKGRPIRRRALEVMHTAMSNYLSRQDGKMIHDPLALAVALDESFAPWRKSSCTATAPRMINGDAGHALVVALGFLLIMMRPNLGRRLSMT